MIKEVTYTQKGDYLIPDIQMETTEVQPLGKYGRMRRAYLQENNPMLMNLALQKHIQNYAKTREIYDAYRKTGYSKKFFEEHRAEITLHKAAKDS